MSDDKFMRMAIAKTMEGIDKGEAPFGACIVKDGEVISCVHNTKLESIDATAHAEVNAIREASQQLKTVDLSGCVLYATCEPCPMCFGASYSANIDKIVFGCRIEDALEMGMRQLTLSCEEMKRLGNSSIEVVGDVLREENLEVFKAWKQGQV